MNITGQKFQWEIEKGNVIVFLGTLFLDVKNWKSESGEIDYTHPETIVYDKENIEDNIDRCIFKNKIYGITITSTVVFDNNVFYVDIKINNKLVLREKREWIDEPFVIPEFAEEDIYS